MSSLTGNALTVLLVGGIVAAMAVYPFDEPDKTETGRIQERHPSANAEAEKKVSSVQGFPGRAVVGSPPPESDNAEVCGGDGADCRAPETVTGWYANRPVQARHNPGAGLYGDAAEVKRVRENYNCDLAVQAREYCEKLQRGEESHRQCLSINLYYSYSRLCGHQP